MVMELLELTFWEIGSNAHLKFDHCCDEADYLETVYKEDGVVELIESKFGSIDLFMLYCSCFKSINFLVIQIFIQSSG